MFVTDRQWEMIRPVLEGPRKNNMGRPRADTRMVFEAVLFVLHTGIQWRYLPGTFPPKSTVHGHLRRWCQSGAFRELFSRVIRKLVETGRIDLDECFVDATFAPAKGGGEEVGLTRKGKGTKMQLVVDAQGLPLAVSTAAASTGETAMVQMTLGFLDPLPPPPRLIGDKAYDSDPLDAALADLGVSMISPHRGNRRPDRVTQDGRPLRRYARRWKVERTIAWLGYHRKLLARWEKNASVFLNFAILGCLMINLRHLPL